MMYQQRAFKSQFFWVPKSTAEDVPLSTISKSFEMPFLGLYFFPISNIYCILPFGRREAGGGFSISQAYSWMRYSKLSKVLGRSVASRFTSAKQLRFLMRQDRRR